jgi:hypothetical protein
MQVGLPSSLYLPLCRAIAHERRIGDSNWMTKPHPKSPTQPFPILLLWNICPRFLFALDTIGTSLEKLERRRATALTKRHNLVFATHQAAQIPEPQGLSPTRILLLRIR